MISLDQIIAAISMAGTIFGGLIGFVYLLHRASFNYHGIRNTKSRDDKQNVERILSPHDRRAH